DAIPASHAARMLRPSRGGNPSRRVDEASKPRGDGMSAREFAWDRRMFLRTLVVAPFAALLTAIHPRAAGALLLLAPTPSTPDDDHDDLEPTHSETAGPFFKPRSPERASLLE